MLVVEDAVRLLKIRIKVLFVKYGCQKAAYFDNPNDKNGTILESRHSNPNDCIIFFNRCKSV